jgi:hypothetical protein
MKPSNTIDRTIAVFQLSSVTYNDPSTTYSSSSVKYGGSDRSVDLGPQNTSTKLSKSNTFEVN